MSWLTKVASLIYLEALYQYTREFEGPRAQSTRSTRGRSIQKGSSKFESVRNFLWRVSPVQAARQARGAKLRKTRRIQCGEPSRAFRAQARKVLARSRVAFFHWSLE